MSNARTDLETLMIASVRADEEVGRGSCSSIEECLTDDELLELLRSENAKGVAGAVEVARAHEGVFRDREQDIRAEAF